jgi:hypothetical protein
MMPASAGHVFRVEHLTRNVNVRLFPVLDAFEWVSLSNVYMANRRNAEDLAKKLVRIFLLLLLLLQLLILLNT